MESLYNIKEDIVCCIISFFVCFAVCFMVYFMFNCINTYNIQQTKQNESNNVILHSMMEHNMSQEQIDMFIKSKTN